MEASMNLTLEDYFTSSGRYPARLDSEEITDTVRNNAILLLARVNTLLASFQVSPRITSGFRPESVNAALKNSGKKSLHCKGMAVDLSDPTGHLKFNIIMSPNLLTQYGLWMEHYTATPGWCHLDTGDRPERVVRIFRP